jgi:hypothetical protein
MKRLHLQVTEGVLAVLGLALLDARRPALPCFDLDRQ